MFKKIFLTSLLMLSFNAFGYQDILAGDKIFYDEASATFADKKCENCIELIEKNLDIDLRY